MKVTYPPLPKPSGPISHRRKPVVLQARYDAAQTTAGNSRHWSMADALTADEAANPEIRRTLRMRGQYEYDNSGYAKGIVNTIANDVVGTGPQLQLRIGTSGLAKRRSAKIEKAFAKWAWAVDLAGKMRLMRIGRAVRGEVFAKTYNNGGLRNQIDLDVDVIEADQVTGISLIPDDRYYDGITYDTFGNPVRYDIAKVRTGASFAAMMPGMFDPVDADYVFHYYRRERPGQRRGIPEMTPALPLFATSRRYTMATLEAAETAANYAVMFETTNTDADGGDSGDETTTVLPPWDLVETERNGGLVVPAGYKANQMKPEQPTTQYGDFIYCIIREIARVLDVPVTIAALDSSKSNLSAAYLDHQTYRKARVIERFELEGFLDWLLAQWIREAAYFHPELRGLTLDDIEYTWRWPSMGTHADPSKVANAQVARIGAGLTNPAREMAEDGLDWEMEQQAAADAFGITLEEYRRLLVQKTFMNGNPPVEQAEPEEEGVPFSRRIQNQVTDTN